MKQYKNIIFDLGGVLIDIDYNAPVKAFKDLGFTNFENMYSQTAANTLFENLETGKILEEDFYIELKKLNKNTITNNQLQTAWNAILGKWRLSSLRFLEKIAHHYNLYLLSNTNQIHYDCFQQSFANETGKPLLDVYFKKAYYSHIIHLRKPETQVYEYVLADAGLQKNETLFIDDSLVNIEGAVKMGLPAYLLKKGELIEELPEFLIPNS